MAAINFDQPSEGHTNSQTPALSIRNTHGAGLRVTNTSNSISAVIGINNPDPIVAIPSKAVGVLGISNSGGNGVRGETNSNNDGLGAGNTDAAGAVVGVSTKLAPGGWFESTSGEGVRGITHSDDHAAVTGVSVGLAPAGIFNGNVQVTRDLSVSGDIRLINADCAEDFDISESENVEAGTVMVLNELGSLRPSCQEYDKKVAGVISGAGGYRPAIILDKQQSQMNNGRLPVALMGKAYCKVDARYSPVEIGDLLTTSSTKGYAMKADDHTRAFGAVIGKALSPIKEGLGMVPILVTLQ